MSTRLGPHELRALERRLSLRLEALAPRPRPAALERVRGQIAVTPQRRGLLPGLRMRLTGVAWNRAAPFAAVAVVGLAIGVGLGASDVLTSGTGRSAGPGAGFGTTWKAVQIEPADTEGDFLVGGGYAGPTRWVLTGQAAIPAQWGTGTGSFPLAWSSEDGMTWRRAKILSAGSTGLTIFDIGPVFAGRDRLYAFGRASWKTAMFVREQLLSVEFESVDDGLAWTQVTDGQPPSGGFVNAVVAGGPGFVAVGDRGTSAGPDAGPRVWTSIDGRSWTSLEDPSLGQPAGLGLAAGSLSAIAEHDGDLLAVGKTLGTVPEQGLALASTDGVTWSRVTLPAEVVPNDVAWFRDRWVIAGAMVGDGTLADPSRAALLWSNDAGRTWSMNVDETAAALVSVAATTDGVIGVGDVDGRPDVWASTDGDRWEQITLPQGPTGGAASLALGTAGRLLVAGNGHGTGGNRLPAAWLSPVTNAPIATASTTASPNASATPRSSLAAPPVFGNWRRLDLPDPAPTEYGGTRPVGIVHLRDRWVAVGYVNGGCCTGDYSTATRGAIWTSVDGLRWTLAPAQASLAEARIYSVASNGKRLVAIGSVDRKGTDGQAVQAPAAWVSTDGLHWEVVTGAPMLNRVVAAGSTFVAVSDADNAVTFYASSDGRTWRASPTQRYISSEGTTVNVRGLAGRSEGAAVAVGLVTRETAVGTISHAASWTNLTPGMLTSAETNDAATMQAVAAMGDRWVAVGEGVERGAALVWESDDGLTWSIPTPMEPGPEATTHATAVLAAGDSLVVTGSGATSSGTGHAAIWIRSRAQWYRAAAAPIFTGEIDALAWDASGERVLAVGTTSDGSHPRPVLWMASQ